MDDKPLVAVRHDRRFGTHSLSGAGQIVAVADSGLDAGDPATVHSDARDRVADVVRGIAPDARVYFQAAWPPKLFESSANPEELGDLFEPAYAAGARIYCNSWDETRMAVPGAYAARARAVDAFLWTHRDMLFLFSAGDIVADADPVGEGDGIVSPASITPPGTARNCLTVGPSGGDQPPGPSQPRRGLDGRGSGTSMAAPLVAGAVALIRQYLIQELGHVLGGLKPSGALLKALIVNGAVPRQVQGEDETPTGPSAVAGFGQVNVKEALGLDGAAPVFFSDDSDLAVQTGELRTFALEAVDLDQPLKLTLAWTDAPSLASQGGLQNVLYFQVCDPAGAVLDGDVEPYPNATNNVQQVTFRAPLAGTYEARVWGVHLTAQLPGRSPDETLRQDFALAASNARSATPHPTTEVTGTPIDQPPGARC